MKNWKSLFGASVLQRGMDYYENGFIRSLQITEKGYHAVVEGSYDYEVIIEMQNNEIVEMSCDCPYAEDGSHCKHMAAVLYKIQEKEQKTGKNWIQELEENKNEIREVIKKISQEELQELVITLALEDESLRNKILLQYSKKIDAKQIANLKKEVDTITDRYTSRYDFVEYREAYGYFHDMGEFLCEKVQILVDNGHLMEAFELTNYVFWCVGNQDVDDSDGGSGIVTESCYDLWQQILEACDDVQKKQMFEWFKEHRSGYVMDYMEEHIEEFLMNEFKDEDMLREKLEALDEIIEKEMKMKNSYSMSYSCQHHILERIAIMEELGCSEKEIIEYRTQYRQFSAIREMEIEDYLQKKEYNKAIAVLKESKEMDRSYPGLVDKYRSQLIDIYEKLGRKKEYKQELLYQVFQSFQRDLTFLKKLKAACEEKEWIELREKFLEKEESRSVRYLLIESEGLYERLLQEIRKSQSIYTLDQYEKTLKKQYPKEIKEEYIKYVRKQAKVVSDRNAYRDLMQYLKKVADYPEGKQEAQKIAEEWKREYKRKPAMMDELKKAGF